MRIRRHRFCHCAPPRDVDRAAACCQPQSLPLPPLHSSKSSQALTPSAHATGASPFAFNGADNGSITRIVMHEAGIKVRSFNDNLHVQSTLHAGSGQLT